MKRKKPVLFGIAVSVFAILLFLSSVDIVQSGIIGLLISSILIIYGIYSLINLNIFSGLFSLAFGFRYSPQLLIDYIDFSKIGYFKLFLIVILLSIGLNALLPKRKRKRSVFFVNFNDKEYSGDSLSGSSVYTKINFGESTRYIYSNDLKDAYHSVNLGSMSVFYQEAILNNDVEITVDVSLGNLELYFPHNWNVVDNISRNLGNVDHHKNNPNSPYTVYVNGSVNLGNVEIKYI